MENPTYKLIKLLPLIKYPLFTEKSYKLHDSGKYTFIVDRSLKKEELKYAFEKIFGIEIKKINTLKLAPKKKRVGRFLGKKSLHKKVILTLKQGYKINNVFEIV